MCNEFGRSRRRRRHTATVHFGWRFLFALREIKFKMYIYYYLRSMSIYEKYTNIFKQNYTVAIA